MNNKAGLQRLNGNTLKVIACIIMLIDHIGAAIVLPLNNGGFLPSSIPFSQVKIVYDIIRAVGRTAFPLFCFLLVEGFVHTKSKLRYGLSLFIFGIISELPYDLALSDGKIDFTDNNVYFTLLLGFLVLVAIEYIRDLFTRKGWPIILSHILSALVFVAIAYTAYALHFDYGYRGVSLITLFYIFRFFEPLNLITGYMVLCTNAKEVYSFPAMILILLYNKKRGRDLGRYKYLFYAFYPAHLLVLYLIRMCIFKALP